MTPDGDRYGMSALRSLGLVGYLGFAMAIPIAAGAWLGSLVDRKTGGSGAFAILGILSGVAAGALSAYKIIMQALAADKTAERTTETGHDRTQRDSDGDPRP